MTLRIGALTLLIALGVASTVAQGVDLTVSATTDRLYPSSYLTGDMVTFTVTMGPSAATNVAVTTVLPVGLTFSSATPPPGGSCWPDTAPGTTVTCTVPSLTGSGVFIVKAVAASAGTFKTVTGAVASDYDSNLSNNSVVTIVAVTQAAAPTVTSVLPNFGTTSGGTVVTIGGTGFRSGATVTIGGAGTTNVIVGGLTSITATTGPHAAGLADVVVTNADALFGRLVSGYRYIPPPTATRFYTVAPCRVIDTRNPTGPLGGPALQPNATRDFVVTGICGIPSTARSVSVNIAVVPVGSGALRLYPAGISPPNTGSINFNAGVIRSNNGVFMLSFDGLGRLSVSNLANTTTDFILDVNGYFR